MDETTLPTQSVTSKSPRFFSREGRKSLEYKTFKEKSDEMVEKETEEPNDNGKKF